MADARNSQVAHFDVPLASEVSSRFLKVVRESVPIWELGQLTNQVNQISDRNFDAVKRLKEQTVPLNDFLDKYLRLAFSCTVLPAKAIVSQLTFVVMADLASTGDGGDFATYRNKNGNHINGNAVWSKTVEHFGLSLGSDTRLQETPSKRKSVSSWMFNQVVLLQQQLRYPESAPSRMVSVSSVDGRSGPQVGSSAEEFHDPKFQDELCHVAAQTLEFRRRVNESLSRIESCVNKWRFALKIVEEDRPKFWLGDNANSFNLAMTELNKFFPTKDPRITSPIRDLRRLLAHRVQKIPGDSEIANIFSSIRTLQYQIALREGPVGEALSDPEKLSKLFEKTELRRALNEKCVQLCQMRQDLSVIHEQIVEDFSQLGSSLRYYERVIEETRLRFRRDQLPRFFGDTELSSAGIIFERAGTKSTGLIFEGLAKSADRDESDAAFIAFIEGSGKEVAGGLVVDAGKSFVSKAQAGVLSKSFLISMKVAPLVGTLVQIAIMQSDAHREMNLIIDEFEKCLPIPSDVFNEFVKPQIVEVFEKGLWNSLKELFMGEAVMLFSGPFKIILAGALTLAEEIQESEEYKELMGDLQRAVGEGFKNWQQDFVGNDS